MASIDLRTRLGPLELATPLVAASGTVGNVWEWATVADTSVYGAAVAKSVSLEPWAGRPPPRLAPTSAGMLNGIGIQNPGLDAWSAEVGPRLGEIGTQVWGSAVGHAADEFAKVAAGLQSAGVVAVEINLSCPNLDSGTIFATDPGLSADVVAAVRNATSCPIGAKLAPDTPSIVEVATACADAGADWVTAINTVRGMGLDAVGRPLLSGVIGGYSGPGIKPIALRCVYEIKSALPELPVLGCGGVMGGVDVLEFLAVGAAAVGVGTAHLAEPRAGKRLVTEMEKLLRRQGRVAVTDMIGIA